MRTTSRNHNSFGSVLAVAAAVLLVVLVVVFRHGVAGLLWSAATPLTNLRNAWGATEAAQLRAQLASTSAQLADRDLLVAENAHLRAELGRAAGLQEVLAGIVQRPPGTPYDTLVVDAGSAQGVALGARVWAGGISIGQVDALYTDSSRVTLYSAPGQSYQTLVMTRSGSIPVGVEGQGGGSMQARVPAGTAVAVGDSVVFPGVAGGLMTKISAISAPAGESFKTIYLHVPINLFELRYVYIQK